MKKNTSEEKELRTETQVPNGLNHLITQEDYDYLISLIQQYFKRNDKKILQLADGKITTKEKIDDNWVECSYGLGNLVRNIVIREKNEWMEMVDYFLGAKIDIPAYLFFSKDYEHAKQYLKILVKPDSFKLVGLNCGPAATTYFPGTISVAVMHYNEQFRFLSMADLKAWNVTIDEVIAEGLSNIMKEQIMIDGRPFYGGEKIFCIISNDYSAASMMQIEKRFPEILGKAGTVFSIPANGTVFAAPLNSYKNLGSMIAPLLSVTALAYRKEHSPIIFDLYHYENGEVSSMVDYIRREHPSLYKVFKMVG